MRCAVKHARKERGGGEGDLSPVASAKEVRYSSILAVPPKDRLADNVSNHLLFRVSPSPPRATWRMALRGWATAVGWSITQT